jgi:hypothetical protein
MRRNRQLGCGKRGGASKCCLQGVHHEGACSHPLASSLARQKAGFHAKGECTAAAFLAFAAASIAPAMATIIGTVFHAICMRCSRPLASLLARQKAGFYARAERTAVAFLASIAATIAPAIATTIAALTATRATTLTTTTLIVSTITATILFTILAIAPATTITIPLATATAIATATFSVATATIAVSFTLTIAAAPTAWLLAIRIATITDLPTASTLVPVCGWPMGSHIQRRQRSLALSQEEEIVILIASNITTMLTAVHTQPSVTTTAFAPTSRDI